MTTALDAVNKALSEIEREGVYSLSGRADCGAPDTIESAGADFLRLVRNSFVERVRWELDNNNLDLTDGSFGIDLLDVIHEVVDGAIPIYTADLWDAFLCLDAWQEDPTELVGNLSSMEEGAQVCLYLVGERLAHDLADDLCNAVESADDDDEGGED